MGQDEREYALRVAADWAARAERENRQAYYAGYDFQAAQAARDRSGRSGVVGYPQQNPFATIKRETSMDRLKNLPKDASVDELIELSACGRSLVAEYTKHNLPAPKWLTEAMRTLASRIKAAVRAEQEEKLRKLERTVEELKSKEEKRALAEKEAAQLRRELGIEEGES